MKSGVMLAATAMAAALALSGCDTIEEAGYFTPVKQADGTTSGVWTPNTPAPTGGPSQMPAPTAAPVPGSVTAQNLKAFAILGSAFTREPSGEWSVYDRAGNLDELYVEDRRDGNIVYLSNPSTKSKHEVDLGRMRIKHSDYYSSWDAAVFTVSATASPRFMSGDVTGANVARVKFSGSDLSGVYAGSGKVWKLVGADGRVGEAYTETMRDAWSVYLSGANGDTMQIDVHRKVVSLGAGGAAMADKWQIVDVAKLTPAAASRPYPSVTGETIKRFTLAGARTVFVYEEASENWIRTNGDGDSERFRSQRRGVDEVVLVDVRGRGYVVDIANMQFFEEKQEPVRIATVSNLIAP